MVAKTQLRRLAYNGGFSIWRNGKGSWLGSGRRKLFTLFDILLKFE